MPNNMPDMPLETIGNGLDSRFHSVTKADAVRCVQAAIESFLAARGMSRSQLAEDLCGVSTSYFSKITNGEQGDFFGFIYDKLPGEIRQDFIERLAELERLDPFALALEQLMVAAIRMIRVSRPTLPARASRMAHAERQSGAERKSA
jgi:hypothetical protein